MTRTALFLKQTIYIINATFCCFSLACDEECLGLVLHNYRCTLLSFKWLVGTGMLLGLPLENYLLALSNFGTEDNELNQNFAQIKHSSSLTV